MTARDGDASVKFHALLLETRELTQPRFAAWLGIRLLLNDRYLRISLKKSALIDVGGRDSSSC